MIGKRIRTRRKLENLSLEQVAKRTGLSIGYLSNLEREQTSPTFDNLILICSAIGVSVVELISSSLEFRPVVKHGEGEMLYSRDYHCEARYTTDTGAPQEMTGLCLTVTGNMKEESPGHDVDELGVIVQGSVIFILDEVTHVLNEGDTIYVQAQTPHTWWKVSEQDVVIYWTRLTERHVRVLHARDTMPDSLEDQV